MCRIAFTLIVIVALKSTTPSVPVMRGITRLDDFEANVHTSGRVDLYRNKGPFGTRMDRRAKIPRW